METLRRGLVKSVPFLVLAVALTDSAQTGLAQGFGPGYGYGGFGYPGVGGYGYPAMGYGGYGGMGYGGMGYGGGGYGYGGNGFGYAPYGYDGLGPTLYPTAFLPGLANPLFAAGTSPLAVQSVLAERALYGRGRATTTRSYTVIPARGTGANVIVRP